jgi:hypothetical protein
LAAAGLAVPKAVGVFPRLCLIRQAEAGQRQAGQADAESLQRLPPCCRLGQSLGQFIEFVVHTFPFVLLFVVWLTTEFQFPGLKGMK